MQRNMSRIEPISALYRLPESQPREPDRVSLRRIEREEFNAVNPGSDFPSRHVLWRDEHRNVDIAIREILDVSREYCEPF